MQLRRLARLKNLRGPKLYSFIYHLSSYSVLLTTIRLAAALKVIVREKALESVASLFGYRNDLHQN